MIITINHIRARGYCAKGIRAFFKKHHINWQDFLKSGVDAEVLIATGNALAIALIDDLKREQGNGQQ